MNAKWGYLNPFFVIFSLSNSRSVLKKIDGYLTPSIFMKNIVLGSPEISNKRQLLVASAWSQRPCLATPGSNPVTAVFPCTVHGNKEKRLPVQKKSSPEINN
jgi:hypothetical protein